MTVESTTTPPPTIDTQKDFCNMFLVGVGVILLLLYTRVVQNRKHWIYLECFVAVIHVIGSTFLIHWMPEFDSVGTYFTRLVVACVVSQAMACYLTEQSTDRTVPISVSISNLLIRGSLLIALECAVYSETLGAQVSGCLGCKAAFLALLLLGDVYHVMVMKTRIFSHRTVGDPISFHLSIDALLSFCFGTFLLGFPKMLFAIIGANSATPMNLLLAQLLGMMLLGGSILSFASLCYRDDEDALNTLKSKLVVYMTAVLLSLTQVIIDSSFRTFGHLGLMTGVMAVLAWNAGNVVYQHLKED